MDKHSAIIKRLLPQLTAQPHVTGVMLQGSVARNDHYPDSDLDFLILLEPGHSRAFESDTYDGITVERHYGNLLNLKQKIEQRPGLTYGITDSQILHDPTGELMQLQQHATGVLKTYAVPQRELSDIKYWLSSTRVKLTAALNAGDELRVGFLASTNTWKILEGLWAINNRPMPPNGAVMAHLSDLPNSPPDLAELLNDLFVGITRKRAAATISLIDWVTQSGRSPSTDETKN